MDVAELLDAGGVVLDIRARDKAALLTELGRLAAGYVPGVPAGVIEAALAARERLGSTGLGAGFALPHARLEELERFIGVFVRLTRPIDFAAIDGKPVDLLFLLLIPSAAADHVAALAAVSRLFRDPSVAAQVRKAGSVSDVRGILTKRS